MDVWVLYTLIFSVGFIGALLTKYFLCKVALKSTCPTLSVPAPGNGNLRRIRTLSGELTDKERALLQATAKFEALFQYAPVAINSFNIDGSVDLWNDECVRILGYTKEEVNTSNDAMELFYGEDAAKAWKDIKKPKGIFREYAPRTKAGKKIKMAWANMPLPSGDAIISVGYVIGKHRKLSTRTTKRGSHNAKRA